MAGRGGKSAGVRFLASGPLMREQERDGMVAREESRVGDFPPRGPRANKFRNGVKSTGRKASFQSQQGERVHEERHQV